MAFVRARGSEVVGAKERLEQSLLSSSTPFSQTPCLAVTSRQWVANDVIPFLGSFLSQRVALVSSAVEEEESNMPSSF